MICLCCGITAHELPDNPGGALVAIQEHAIQEHGFTIEEFPHQTRTEVADLPAGAAYVWQRANGSAWLLAIANDQGISEDTIAGLRLQLVQASASAQSVRLVQVGVARELADGSRTWSTESVPIPADTMIDAIAATAVALFWNTGVPHDQVASTIRHVWLHAVPELDASVDERSQPFDLSTLDPALLRPTVMASCHTDDWAIDLGCETGDRFDATPFFASASDQELRDLIAIDFGGDLAADALAELAETYDPRVVAMFAYIRLRGQIGF
jgi:hypothetical protein